MNKRPDDVRSKKMGEMIGEGADVQLDMERAVLMDGLSVCLVNATSNAIDGLQRGPATSTVRLAMNLEGRVNKSDERASVLYLFDEDGAAAIISELLDLATRVGPEFSERLMERLENLKKEDQ